MSWTERDSPVLLEKIREFDAQLSLGFLDVGGGMSRTIDRLAAIGYCDLTLLDVSESAITRSRQRWAESGIEADSILTDILSFTPRRKWGVWHDRAVLHFLNDDESVSRYFDILASTLVHDGVGIISTFASDGPEKCSGLRVRRYDTELFNKVIGSQLQTVQSWTWEHLTPWESVQNFNSFVVKLS